MTINRALLQKNPQEFYRQFVRPQKPENAVTNKSSEASETAPNARIIQVNEKYFNQIRDGRKTLEIRLIDDDKKKGNIGEILVYKCGEQTLIRKIISVKSYIGFNSLSKAENLAYALPDVPNNQMTYRKLANSRYPESENLDTEKFEAWEIEEIKGLSVTLNENKATLRKQE